jgi:peroxiredoxin
MSTSLGAEAPQFDLPGVDGQNHTLGSYADTDVLVLVQSCNHCPYVQAWEGRLSAIASDYADRGVGVVAVNSNDADSHPEDSFDEMQKRSREQGFTFDYLYDEPQAVARALEAERTRGLRLRPRPPAAVPRRDRRQPRRDGSVAAVPARRAGRGARRKRTGCGRDAPSRVHREVALGARGVT